MGGFQLVDLNITELKSHMIKYNLNKRDGDFSWTILVKEHC